MEEKITIYICMSTTGQVAIATESQELADDVNTLRNAAKDPKNAEYAVLTMSASKDKAIALLKKELESRDDV